ncbi:MAG: NTPase [Bacillota bacterium]
MAKNDGPKILLTGQPGIGKTTVIVRLASLLGESAAGFYTAELREKGKRVGFKVVTLGGREETLSHVDLSSPYKVGKYGVNLTGLAPAFAEIENALEQQQRRCLLIDEIGRMELLVPGFHELILRVFESPLPLVATVPLKPLPFTDALKRKLDVTLFQVTVSNREELPAQIYAALSTAKI